MVVARQSVSQVLVPLSKGQGEEAGSLQAYFIYLFVCSIYIPPSLLKQTLGVYKSQTSIKYNKTVLEKNLMFRPQMHNSEELQLAGLVEV